MVFFFFFFITAITFIEIADGRRSTKGMASKANLAVRTKRACVGCYEPSNVNLIATS